MDQLPSENAAQQEPTSWQKNAPASKDGQQCPSVDFAALIDAITAEGRAYRAEEQREDKGKTFREWITVVLLGATMVAIFWQVYEMVHVYGPIRDQAEASKIAADAATKQSENSDKTLIQTQRAWVGPTDAKIEGVVEIGKQVKVIISVLNTGREPAKNFSWSVAPFTVTNDGNSLLLSQDMNLYVAKCFATPSITQAQVLYPAVGFGSGFEFHLTIPDTQIDASVIDGSKILIARGCIVYDTFGETKHSAFCYFYKGGGFSKPDHLNICVGGSDAS
jgi:hypothetical protein